VSPATLEWRGDRIPCSPDVAGFGRHFGNVDSSFKVHVGGILSGDKLINDEEFRDRINGIDPKCIGGEMEAAGIVTSCSVKGVPFSVVKGVCDFAAQKNDSYQAQSALNAFKFTFSMLGSFFLAGVFYAKERQSGAISE
jgi:nucleoside phosphorylase